MQQSSLSLSSFGFVSALRCSAVVVSLQYIFSLIAYLVQLFSSATVGWMPLITESVLLLMYGTVAYSTSVGGGVYGPLRKRPYIRGLARESDGSINFLRKLKPDYTMCALALEQHWSTEILSGDFLSRRKVPRPSLKS